MTKNLIDHLNEIGIGRNDILNLTESDYVRLSKLIKLKFKQQDEHNVNVLSNLLDVLRNDLDNLKAVFAEDMIYYTLSGQFINAKKSESFNYSSEKNASLEEFILKYFKSDLMDEFVDLIVVENYRDLNAWMRIAAIYPEELIIEVQLLMIQKVESVLEIFEIEMKLNPDETEMKFLRSDEFYNVLSIKENPYVADKLDELVNWIFDQFRNIKSRPTRLEFDLLSYIKNYKYLSDDSLEKIEMVVELYFEYGEDNEESGSNFKLIRIVAGIVVLIFVVFVVKSFKNESTIQSHEDTLISNEFTEVKSKTYLSAANSHLLMLAATTGSDCKRMYEMSYAQLVPHNRSNNFNYKEEHLDLKSGEMATMGLDVELPSFATGKDICFINKCPQPVLIVIVRPNYIFSKRDLSILPGSGNDLACGRYYVAAGKSFKFDSRVNYFKIQTGKDLKQVKISGSHLNKTLTGYAFCPFTDLDAMLFNIDFKVNNSTNAIGGVMELTKSSSNYKLLWKGNDSTLSIYKDVYLKKNSTFTLGK